MTKEEYDNLNIGDIVENKIGSRKTIVQSDAAIEPLTQIKKDNLLETFKNYKIITKSIK